MNDIELLIQDRLIRFDEQMVMSAGLDDLDLNLDEL